MPLPLPEDFRALIPNLSGNLCDEFDKLFKFPELFAKYYESRYTDGGELTEEFRTLICDINCDETGSGGAGGGGLEAPQNVEASDGDFEDKVHVTWDPVTGATSYKVYRSLTNDSTTAVFQATVTAPTLAYDDTTVAAATTYFYWVKALTPTSVFSLSDSGYAGTIPETLAPVTDLRVGKGFGFQLLQYVPYTGPSYVVHGIPLVWTAPANAQSYDIYRSDTDDILTATLIKSDAVPFDNSLSLEEPQDPPLPSPGVLRYCYDGGDFVLFYDATILYSDTVGGAQKWYYWVKAKRSTPTSEISPASNSGAGAAGWSEGDGGSSGVPMHTSYLLSEAAGTATSGALVADTTQAFFVLFGSNGCGAGGGSSKGGGGGGASAVIVGKRTVVAGGKFRIRSNPTGEPAATAAATSGAASPITILEYSAIGDFSDTVSVAEADSADGGIYNAAGGGVGGGGVSGTIGGGVTESEIFDGFDGGAASGAEGGRGGAKFGSKRQPPAHFSNQFFYGSWGGNGTGCGCHAGLASLAIGDPGKRGVALVWTFKAP